MHLPSILKASVFLFKNYLFLHLLLLSGIVFSQTNGLKDNITRINLTLIGSSLTSELKLGKSTSIFGEAGINTYVEFSNSVNDPSSEFIFSAHPYFQLEPRLYYNLQKRFRNGKNTMYNHGGFLALSSGYFFKSLNQDGFKLDGRFFIGPLWGFQVFVKNRFTFETRLGLAYLGGKELDEYPEEKQSILPITDIRFGIILNK